MRDGMTSSQKTIVIIMFTVLVMLVGFLFIQLSSGNINGERLIKEDAETIILTKDNFTNYFFIEYEVENYNKESSTLLNVTFYDASADIVVTLGKKMDFQMENVIVEMKVEIKDTAWGIVNDKNIVIREFNIPSSGMVEKVFYVEVEDEVFASALNEPTEIDIEIISASGKIILD